MDGSSARKLRELFVAHYYPHTALATAMRLVHVCLDGETAEWEEQMVADLVCVRGDAIELVRAIGRGYGGSAEGPDADLRNGLNKLEWQLDGDDETRVQEAMSRAGVTSRSGLFW